MKAPLDPSEPLFPLRPNEPVCQYYMKHGTCKFAQACKFHHPLQLSQQGMTSNGPLVMLNVLRSPEPHPVVLNPVSLDGNTLVQFLPQRPDEPDCIYFLKNGRCKYGATCRYHHPLNYHKRRAEEQRRHHEHRRNVMPEMYSRQVQYVSHQAISGLHPGTVLLADDRDRSNVQPVALVNGVDGSSTYCVPISSTVRTSEMGSSTSSIASSFDNEAEGSLAWNRRTGSGSSLNLQNIGEARHQSRVVLPHSVSEGNISRRLRASSHGSSGDAVDASIHASSRRSPGNGWRQERGMSEQGTRQRSSNRQEKEESRISDTNRGRLPRRRIPHQREGDEGFTMMTSALLNMLDTPQEVSGENHSDDESYVQESQATLPTSAASPQTQGNYCYNDDIMGQAMFSNLSIRDPESPSFPSHAMGLPKWSADEHRLGHMLHSGETASHSFQNQDGDVGLYLP